MTNEFFIVPNISQSMVIRLERVRRKWRQVDLAEKAGVTQAEVSAAERGLYVIPSARTRILQTLELITPEAGNGQG